MNMKSLVMPTASVLLAAALLFGTSAALSGVTEKNARAELENAIAFVLPESKTFTEEVYDGEDEAIRSVHKGETGFVVETVTSGYAGEIVMLVGVNNDGTVAGATVRKMSETWGLGSQALVDYNFLVQFMGTEGDAEVGGNVDALTGATVTSKAITRGINAAVAYVTGADTSSGATSWGG